MMLLVLATAWAAVPAPIAASSETPPDLGLAAQFAIFGLKDGSCAQDVHLSNGSVSGDVGVAAGASGSQQSPFTINGDVYIDAAADWTSGGTHNGTFYADQDLAGARDDAYAAAAYAASLAPDYVFGDVTAPVTVNATGDGLTVIEVYGDINLGGDDDLILSGGGWFVINLAGSLGLDGSADIRGAGGTTPAQVLVNMTGSGSLAHTHIGNLVQGTLLGPAVGGTLHGVAGAVMLGCSFSIMSGATVEGIPYSPPASPGPSPSQGLGPTSDPTATPDPSSTPNPTSTPDPSSTPIASATPDAGSTPDPTPDPTPSPAASATTAPSASPDPTPTVDPTAGPTDPTPTPDPLPTPSAMPDTAVARLYGAPGGPATQLLTLAAATLLSLAAGSALLLRRRGRGTFDRSVLWSTRPVSRS